MFFQSVKFTFENIHMNALYKCGQRMYSSLDDLVAWFYRIYIGYHPVASSPALSSTYQKKLCKLFFCIDFQNTKILKEFCFAEEDEYSFSGEIKLITRKNWFLLKKYKKNLIFYTAKLST